MDIPQHPQQLQISSTIKIIEKNGTDGTLCQQGKKAKLELLYVVDISGKKEVYVISTK
jgi:hypothetical protein